MEGNKTMSDDAKKDTKPFVDTSVDVPSGEKTPVSGGSGGFDNSFIPDAGLLDVAGQANAGISEQLHLHQEKTKPPKKSDPIPTPGDINLQPIKWFETDMFGRLKRDDQGNPKRRNGRPKNPRKGDKLVGGGTWPPATASTIRDQSTVTPGQPGAATPGDQPKRMDLGDEAGEILTDHLNRLGHAIGGEHAEQTPVEKKVMSKALAASLGEWQIWPPLAVLVFGALYLVRVKITSAIESKKQEKQTNERQTHRNPGNNGQRQDSARKKTVYSYDNG
jgi:hypothetical protein